MSVFHYLALHKSPHYLEKNPEITLQNSEKFEILHNNYNITLWQGLSVFLGLIPWTQIKYNSKINLHHFAEDRCRGPNGGLV